LGELDCFKGKVTFGQHRRTAQHVCLLWHAMPKEQNASRAPAAHVWNPRYQGSWGQEDRCSRPAWANALQDSHLQNNCSCGSTDWTPGLRAWSPEFKPHPTPKKPNSNKNTQNSRNLNLFIENLPTGWNQQGAGETVRGKTWDLIGTLFYGN
jgi:hypothetical protein